MSGKLQEKASIDWNNYLTPKEVEKFLGKDDKVESAEEIVYNTKGNFCNQYFKDFKKQGWTKRELTQDLANFYHNGHLITEEKVQGIPNKYQHMVKDFYKGADGYYVIELKDGYEDGFGHNYIWEKYKTVAFDVLDRIYNDYIELNKGKKLNENKYVLRGSQNNQSFDVASSDSKEKLEKFADEMKPGNPNVTFWIDENNTTNETKHLTEGIHLYGFVKDEDGNYKTIEDNDYPDKKSFENDLRDNGYIVRRVNDNRDNYIMDHSDYLSINNIKNEITKLKKDYNYYKENGLETLCISTKSKIDSLQKLLDEANKVSLTESYKLEEVSRNELLAKTKSQTKTRYEKADGYKGFGLKGINTDKLLKDGTLPVTCKVGKYEDTVELQNVPYWIQLVAKQTNNNQINNHVVRDAILKAVDAMDIKVDCSCADWQYRFKYMASKYNYNYGREETRPANITNPEEYGALCKHLSAMLSNKKWMQQVAAPTLDYLEGHMEELNKFLRVREGEELTLPNELARSMAKKSAANRKEDRQQRLQEVTKEFIQQRKNFIIRNANNEDELREGIQAYINYKYKDPESGVDYLKADTMEIEYILELVNKWLLDHNYKKDYEAEFEKQNNEEGDNNNEEPKE